MSGLLTTVLVVPCYNEAQRLDPDAFAAFRHGHPDVRFLFVDDGSTDATADLLESLVGDDRIGLAMQRLPRNQGKAEAVRRGLLDALVQPGVDVVGYWDADLATPLDAIPAFLDVLHQREGVEMVLGARVKLLGREVSRRFTRHVFGRAAATAASGILGLPVYDTQCGAKVFRANAAMLDILQRPFVTRWAFDVELLQRWRIAHSHLANPEVEQRVVELPLLEWNDVRGSKVSLWDMTRAPYDLARIWVDGRRQRARGHGG